MATPSTFFSTLAQVTSAALGLVIAFTTAIYTVERNRIRNEISSYNSNIDEIEGQYASIFESMADALGNCGDFSTDDVPEEFTAENEEPLVSWAEDQQTPRSAQLYAYLNSIQTQLSHILLTGERESSEDNINHIQFCIERSKYFLGPDNNQSESIYSEVTGNDPDQRPSYTTEDIFGGTERIGNVRAFLRDIPYDDQNYAAIEGWRNVIQVFDEDLNSVLNQYDFESLRSDNEHITDLIRKSLILFIVGIVIPVGMLLSLPDSVPTLTGWLLVIVEIINLLLVLVFSYFVFVNLRDLLEMQI